MKRFTENKKIFFGISIAIVALSIILSFVMGVQLDIQFKGGSMITYSYEGQVDTNTVSTVVTDTLGKKANIQTATDVVTGGQTIVLSLDGVSLSSEDVAELSDALIAAYPDAKFEMIKIDSVDPTIGKEFFQKCLLAVVFAAVLMVIYVAIRFRKIGGWSAGAMAVVALVHDLIVIYTTFVVFRIPLNENFIAVMLTILGYSLNDTIVIYDRIRENDKLYGKTKPLAEMVDLSLNQSFLRTLMTSVTTVVAMSVVCVMGFIYQLDSIISFALPLIVGMISGVYSSLCVAPCLWVTWKQRKAAH